MKLHIVIQVALLFVVLLGAAFCEWSVNPGDWPKGVRTFCVVAWIFLTPLAGGAAALVTDALRRP